MPRNLLLDALVSKFFSRLLLCHPSSKSITCPVLFEKLQVSLYRRLLRKVAEAAPLSASELRMLRELGAELEAAA